MRTQTKVGGFSAYEEIRALAKETFPGKGVDVQASIFGNDYQILVDGKIISGTSQTVREILKGVKL